jgi:type IV secretory pathway TrbL component
MKLTRGERRALLCLVPVVVSFLPPVTTWAASVETRVLGLPFLVFWNGLSVAMTAAWMTLALRLLDRSER